MKYYKNQSEQPFAFEDDYTPENGFIEITKEEALALTHNAKTPEQKKKERYSRLEEIFVEKTIGLKKIAIDKPWMSDPAAVNSQYVVYEELYNNAKKGLYDPQTNEAIIFANESTKEQLAPITHLLNSVRSTIENAIAADNDNADTLLEMAATVSLDASDITQKKVDEIKTTFGLN